MGKQETLYDALKQLPAVHYVVVEGAVFPSFTNDLRAHGLSAIPLYLGAPGSTDVEAGPHIIAITSMQVFRKVCAFIGTHETGVFWSWPSGMDTLIAHLRKLNAIEIPKSAPPDDVEHQGLERVILRHADPKVMALLLRVLEPKQLRATFGQARGLVMYSKQLGGVQVWK